MSCIVNTVQCACIISISLIIAQFMRNCAKTARSIVHYDIMCKFMKAFDCYEYLKSTLTTINT